MSDYPDWQAFPNATSGNLFPATTQNLPAGLHSTPVTPAVNWSSVTVLVNANAGGVITINHFADPAGAVTISTDTWRVNATTRLLVQTPLRARYVRVDINVTAPAGMTALTWASLISAASDRISFPVGQQHAADTARTLAAGASATYTLPLIVAGTALAYLTPHDTAGKLTMVIHAVDESGNLLAPVADFGAPAATTQQLIVVPDQILQVTVTNTDTAAAHAYDMALTVPPQ